MDCRGLSDSEAIRGSKVNVAIAQPDVLSPIETRNPCELRPAPQNEMVYRKLTRRLVADILPSIRARGVLEPIVASRDGYVLSGHRRLYAARLAGCESVPVRSMPVTVDDPDFLRLLVEYNTQRVKTSAEAARESLVKLDPAELKREVEQYQKAVPNEFGASLVIYGGRITRAKISKAKRPFADAIIEVVNDHKPTWPMTARSIHYRLLNVPGLMRTAKTESNRGRKLGTPYANDKPSYKDCCDMGGRLRLSGEIPWGAIIDETRKTIPFPAFSSPAEYQDKEIQEFLAKYHRDCLQAQDDYIECVCEKHTLENFIRPVCEEFGIQILFGRGSSSLDARYRLVRRWKLSGKKRLVLLILGDLDPAGEDIVQSLANSMINDFGVEVGNLIPVKVALTDAQVRRFQLPPSMEAKQSSPGYKKYALSHGTKAWELEALPTENLRKILRDSIIGFLDQEKYAAERQQEAADLAEIVKLRKQFQAFWKDIH